MSIKGCSHYTDCVEIKPIKITRIKLFQIGYCSYHTNGYKIPFEREVQHKNWRRTVKIQLSLKTLDDETKKRKR